MEKYTFSVFDFFVVEGFNTFKLIQFYKLNVTLKHTITYRTTALIETFIQ